MKRKDAEQYRVDADLYRIPHAAGDDDRTAVLFVHGFTGDGIETWGQFPERLLADPDMAGHDFFFWQYPSSLNPIELVTRSFWSADPDVALVGASLRSVLNTNLADYDRLQLVAHSMGGLVVQAFVMEEVERAASQGQASEHLDRLAEVVLYATPSGGLESARRFGFFKRQIEDMSKIGPFITGLREAWVRHVDDRKGADDRPCRFLLTLVAGQRDKFVPEESTLAPFPLDEHEVVPGNHVELVKPEKSGNRTVEILKRRLLRGNPTAEQLRIVHGQSGEAVELVARARAAGRLGDVAALTGMCDELLKGDPELPTVELAVALLLSGQREHGRAVRLFERYLDFRLEDGSLPFVDDAYAVQQYAVSLSALGRNLDAVTRLEQLPEDIRADPETMGISAGRFKREWLTDRANLAAGRQSFQTYFAAFGTAKQLGDVPGQIYNGINAAFMGFMLGLPHEALAAEVLEIAAAAESSDYWALATKAEALLLLGRYAEAEEAYRLTFVMADMPRYLATTAAQALNIAAKLGDPPEVAGLRELIDANYESLDDAVEAQQVEAEEKELSR